MPPIIRSITVLAVFATTFTILQAVGKPAPAEVALRVSFGHGTLDTITSDSFTPPGYPEDDYVNGVENVLAIIQGSGNFRFDTQHDANVAPDRRICIDFGNQFADQGLVVPFSGGNPRQCVIVEQPMLGYSTVDVSIANLTPGQSVQKLTRLAWDDGTYRYRIGYGTNMDMEGDRDSPPVNVTCIAPAAATLPCTTWLLAPSTDGTAALYSYKLTIRKNAVQEGPPVLVGHFKMPFAQTLTRK